MTESVLPVPNVEAVEAFASERIGTPEVLAITMLESVLPLSRVLPSIFPVVVSFAVELSSFELALVVSSIWISLATEALCSAKHKRALVFGTIGQVLASCAVEFVILPSPVVYLSIRPFSNASAICLAFQKFTSILDDA